ncbi:histidine phosphatase family protein [Rhodoplanes roseus]|uniref:Histidine phosphatase family protein n=1 Tax=Rhodoplanes roseus TaxID=29409 RepID=A0A327L1Y6_9BRAD|nr:histidine phosphatase family protein [Rhodoplanes roseus]RAI45090.1 histidine phosphatase family protein [Rhodoplanes roseus]
MTTTFFLVRHAVHGLLDRVLVGRSPGVSLSDLGRRQAAALAERLARESLTAVHASPRERAQETAHPIAATTGRPVTIAPDLDEIDVGEWTGRSFDEMSDDPRWQAWNSARASARTPGGESMREVQDRVVRLLGRLSAVHPDGRIAAVSHGDVIRAALLHYLGLGLDAYDRIEVSPAGVSTVVVGPWGAKILSLNERVAA